MKFNLLLFIFICAFQINSFAWSRKAHEIIAEIAMRFTEDSCKKNVLAILGGKSFFEASVWMDEMRSQREYDFMKPWHYINIDKGSNYLPTTDENIVNQLIVSLNELKHKNTLCLEQLRTDVMVLMHLVGDLHQPLHVGYGSDKGGNTIQVSFLGKGSNLHAVWDNEIVQNQNISVESCLGHFNTLTPEQIEKITKIDVVNWLERSRNDLTNVYSFQGHKIDIEYCERNKPVIEKELFIAGLRLARIFNKYFKDIASSIINQPQIPTVLVPTAEITLDQVNSYMNQTVLVCGMVYDGKYFGRQNSPTLINMGANYPNSPLTIVIMAPNRSKFNYQPEKFLKNKPICVTGTIISYKGRPEIIVSDPKYLEIKDN